MGWKEDAIAADMAAFGEQSGMTLVRQSIAWENGEVEGSIKGKSNFHDNWTWVVGPWPLKGTFLLAVIVCNLEGEPIHVEHREVFSIDQGRRTAETWDVEFKNERDMP